MHKDLIAELYTEHYRSAYAYVFSLCGNSETTEDIVSQAFERAIRTIDDSIPHFRFWLMRVCRNLWLDKLRQEKNTSHIPIDQISLKSKTDVAEEVFKIIENERLYEAIGRLNYIDKEIVVLFYLSGLSIKEISRVTGIGISATKVKLHRARLRLRKLMEDLK